MVIIIYYFIDKNYHLLMKNIYVTIVQQLFASSYDCVVLTIIHRVR